MQLSDMSSFVARNRFTGDVNNASEQHTVCQLVSYAIFNSCMTQVAYMYNDPPTIPSLMSLSMSGLVVVIVLQEEVLVCAVSGECHRRDAQSGEAASESLKSGERAVVSPRLSESNSQ